MLEADVQRIKDEEHLRVLGILNYVASALFAFVVLSGIPFIVMVRSHRFAETFERARAEAAADRTWGHAQGPVPDVMVGHMEAFMLAFIGTWLAIAVLATVLSFLNGRYLRSYRHPTFSTVVAVLQCLAVPLGTVLGVFTLIVLGRSTVQDAYAQRRGEPALVDDD